ncbi:hypothetical protein ACFYUJ_28840 [Streptomyces sp. NPDC004520]|uniref:hypothetical protein n=1 Tax=Streptomyces sp. NPDC004520 TaxID=3364702 RepID=UPI00368DCDE7
MSRILLRGAQVITMTPHRPDAEHVDILVDGGTIAAVGDVFKAPDAEIVDFPGRVIIGQPALNGCCATPWSTIPSTICAAELTSRPASRRNSRLRAGCGARCATNAQTQRTGCRRTPFRGDDGAGSLARDVIGTTGEDLHPRRSGRSSTSPDLIGLNRPSGRRAMRPAGHSAAPDTSDSGLVTTCAPSGRHP